MIGFSFNGQHSSTDLGLIMEFKHIQPPVKKKIKESVPFMNSTYDFSTVGSGGEIVYADRPIKTQLHVVTPIDKEEMQIIYDKVMEWLLGTGKQQLIFDDIPGYYFMAEVEEISDWEEFLSYGQFPVTFICEPFKNGVDLEGQVKWDTFNFETDYIQETEFDVAGTKTVTIYNPGRTVTPVVNVNSNMTCLLNGYTANFVVGDNSDYSFKLLNGANTIVITGYGHIKFNIRKQVI